MTYGAFLSVAVETRETGRDAMGRRLRDGDPGRVFDMFTNQAHALRASGARRPGGSLMLFAGGRAAAALLRRERRGRSSSASWPTSTASIRSRAA